MAEIVDLHQRESVLDVLELVVELCQAAKSGDLRGLALVGKHSDGCDYLSYVGEWDEQTLAEVYLMLDDMAQDIKAWRNESGEA